jgi:hypothetical protein
MADESAAEYFAKDRMYWSKGLKAPESSGWVGGFTGSLSKNSSKVDVAKAVADEARSRLGSGHVEDALRLTRLESGFQCHVLGPKTKHGRAVGPLQVIPSSAFELGITAAQLSSDCKAQIAAGILHMDKCLKSGANTYKKMAACHVAGWRGWNVKLSRKAEAYKQKYVRLAQASSVPSWVGSLR